MRAVAVVGAGPKAPYRTALPGLMQLDAERARSMPRGPQEER